MSIIDVKLRARERVRLNMDEYREAYARAKALGAVEGLSDFADLLAYCTIWSESTGKAEADYLDAVLDALDGESIKTTDIGKDEAFFDQMIRDLQK